LDTVFPTVEGDRWRSRPGAAVLVAGSSFQTRIRSEVGGEVDVLVGRRRLRVRRPDIGVDRFAADIELALPGDGDVTVVIDHGTLEVFTPDGRSISMLVFAGPDFTVETTGDAVVRSTVMYL